MGRRLYVGNLPYKTNDEDLNALFSQAGAVESVRVMRDMATAARAASRLSTWSTKPAHRKP